MKEVQRERETFCDKVENLDSYTHEALGNSNFPSHQRYYLCLEIQQLVGEIMSNAIRMKKGYGQKSTLERMDIAVDTLRYKIREAERKQYISLHRRHVWIGMIDEIGKMIGGWIEKKNAAERSRTGK